MHKRIFPALLMLCTTAHADELVTDRPDATESSSVVAPGFVQLEAGWTVTEDAGGTESQEFPQTLVRIGVVENVELRLGWGGYVDSDAPASDGIADGELGTKIYLMEENGSLPEVALLAAISLPWGDEEVTSDEVDPNFRFAFAHTLNETFSFGYNLGVEWATEGGSTESSFIYTAALGTGITDKLGAYIEVFGDAGLSASGDSHSFDGGFTYLVAENFQLDVLAGVGLSDDADDWFAGAGVSYRFPN